MKRLSLYLFLILFTLQTPSQADDIRDFQIEGMSIGDSLLDYFSESEINSARDESTKDKIFIQKTFFAKNSDIYDGIQVSYKNSDSKKIIYNIAGFIFYPNNINECKKKMKNIISEISELFPNAFEKNWGKFKMPDKQGYYFPVTFDLKDGSRAMVSCQDWRASTDIDDNFKISLYNSEFSEYLKAQN